MIILNNSIGFDTHSLGVNEGIVSLDVNEGIVIFGRHQNVNSLRPSDA